MDRAALDRIASRQHGLITNEQLRDIGTRREIDGLITRLLITRVRPSVYRLNGTPTTWHQQALAVQLDASEAVISHHAALFLHGLSDEPCQPEITIPSQLSRRMRNVIVHTSTAIERVTIVSGIRATNVARTLIDVAYLLPPRQVTSLIEDALAKRMTSFPMLRRELALVGGHGRRGVGVIRKLLDAYDPCDERAEIGLERTVLREMRKLGMPKPQMQWHVFAEGRDRYIDFAYPEAKIGLEAHSVTWHTRLSAFERDWDRDGALKSEGWTIYYVTNLNMTKGLKRVHSALKASFLVQKSTQSVSDCTKNAAS